MVIPIITLAMNTSRILFVLPVTAKSIMQLLKLFTIASYSISSLVNKILRKSSEVLIHSGGDVLSVEEEPVVWKEW